MKEVKRKSMQRISEKEGISVYVSMRDEVLSMRCGYAGDAGDV